MRECTSCGQLASQKVSQCPACGSPLEKGIRHIDDYKILAIIHEGRSSMVCKAVKEGSEKPVSIRIFSKKADIDDAVAQRLKRELEELKKLPEDYFVQHFSVHQSSDGHWYRVSEWVDAHDWGTVFMSGLINDQRKMVLLFKNIASVLALLNRQDHFMPYLILDDILIPKKNAGQLNVKINYKLSRFLNARATHHGPMLQKLLECHPDIINERAIDFKTGIWSLGKIFVELLTADHNLKDFTAKVDTIPGLQPDLKILLKIMLADDPDLRPQSMTKVVSALSSILEILPYGAPLSEAPVRKTRIFSELNRLKKTVVVLMMIIAGTALFSTGSWIYTHMQKNRQEQDYAVFVESYTNSTAFLLVEYSLNTEDRVVYKNKIEGTAFLVDKEGLLLTNRHVACPWLEDSALFQSYQQLALLKQPVTFKYKMYLWFEGAKAFNRLPDLKDSEESSDSYYLTSAFTSGENGNLRIAGVPRTSYKVGELIKSPFKNDFAVLKVDGLPDGLTPLPIDTSVSAEKVKRLEPVFILGFPLGNRTQEDRINTSITRGHVRRTSPEIIQVDSSIYKGNSGGPAIDRNGKVIGIASGVMTDQLSGYLKLTTPLSDFGLILPISRPAKFIKSIKNGNLHWDGLIDFAIESKLEQINLLAMENKFKDAALLAEKFLGSGTNPPLLYAGGMMNFCAGDFKKSKTFFTRLNAVEDQNSGALLMLYLIDWIQSKTPPPKNGNPIFQINWYSENEYFRFLAEILKNNRQINSDLVEYEDRSEKSWRLFTEGLIAEKSNRLSHAQQMYQQAITSAAGKDWVYYLAFSRLILVHEALIPDIEDNDYRRRFNTFGEKAKEGRKLAAEQQETMAVMVNVIESDETPQEIKETTYEQLQLLAPENRYILGRMAFFHATYGNWSKALDYIDLYFKQPSRETALGMSLNLLKAQILNITGKKEAYRSHMAILMENTRTPWYRIVIKQLMSKPDKKLLAKLAGDTPEKLIILHTALGMWEEAHEHPEQAVQHYREALSSYLDSWNEYRFSLGRILQLRKDQG